MFDMAFMTLLLDVLPHWYLLVLGERALSEPECQTENVLRMV